MPIRSPLFALALLTGLGAGPGLVDAASARPAPAVRPVEAPLVQAQAPLGAVFSCYRRAYDDTKLGERFITELCGGAADAGPVDCFLAARNRTGLAIDDAIALCRCASSAEPVACFEQGRRITPLDSGSLLSVCAPAQHFDLDATCTAPIR